MVHVLWCISFLTSQNFHRVTSVMLGMLCLVLYSNAIMLLMTPQIIQTGKVCALKYT